RTGRGVRVHGRDDDAGDGPALPRYGPRIRLIPRRSARRRTSGGGAGIQRCVRSQRDHEETAEKTSPRSIEDAPPSYGGERGATPRGGSNRSFRAAVKRTALLELASWASALKLAYVPRRVREQAVNQLLSMLAAVYSGYDSDLGAPIERAFASHTSGAARIFPTRVDAPPSHAAMVMASWSMVLDYDDVMLGGHAGHSSVLVPLSMASGHSGSMLLLAQIVANEIAARINMVCALGSTRGQMATHLHLIAAAAAKAKLERLDAEEFAAALGFALSYPSQALYPAFLGS